MFEETSMHPLTLLSINSQIAAVILFPLWALNDGYAIWTEYTAEHDISKHTKIDDPGIFTATLLIKRCFRNVQLLHASNIEWSVIVHTEPVCFHSNSSTYNTFICRFKRD